MASLPDPAPVIQLIEAFRQSKTMFVAVSLGVFDRLERSPADLHSLASDLRCQSDPLERLLDACVGLRLLRKEGGIYSNQAVANTYLTRTSPNTLAGYILYSDQVLFRLWSRLENAVREGGAQWKEISQEGGGIFDQFFRTDETMRTFLDGMHGLGVLSSVKVIDAFDLSPFRRFVDLGGATGHLAIAACERYPKLHAILFDAPRVIESVRSQVSGAAVGDRIELTAGDFFDPEQIPDGDLYGLSRILHDWPDDKVRSLLGAIYQRLPTGGGLLIAEKLLDEDKSGPTSAHMQSLNMLVCTEGKERTLTEYRALLEAAGFSNVGGHRTGTTLDAVFATKA